MAQDAYRVAYLVPNPRRDQPGQEVMLRQLYVDGDVLLSMDDAMRFLRDAKRRGFTAWITDAAGTHVPVPGATRIPKRYSI